MCSNLGGRGGKTFSHVGITRHNRGQEANLAGQVRLPSTLPAFLLGPWRLWRGAWVRQAHLRQPGHRVRLHLPPPGRVLCQGMPCLPQPAKADQGSFMCWKNFYCLAYLELVFIVTENWGLLKKVSILGKLHRKSNLRYMCMILFFVTF